MFPVPFTSAFLDRLVQSIGQPLQAACAHGACGPDAECLSAASHLAITRDARTVEVTSFRKWFRDETRSIKLVMQDIYIGQCEPALICNSLKQAVESEDFGA